MGARVRGHCAGAATTNATDTPKKGGDKKAAIKRRR